MVFDYSSGCSVDLSMHVEVVLLHVAFEKELVLLCIATGKNEVVLARNEPVELLEPVDFSDLFHLDSLLVVFHFFERSAFCVL